MGFIDPVVLKSRHRRIPALMIYRSPRLEGNFVLLRSANGKYRVVWTAFWTMLATVLFAIAASITNDELHNYTIRVSIASAVIIVLEMACIIAASRIGGSAAPFQATNQQLMLAYVREALAMCMSLYYAVEVGIFSAENSARTRCVYLHTYDNRVDNTLCPLRLYTPWFLLCHLPIVIGRPRFALSLLFFLCAFLSALLAHTDMVPLSERGMWAGLATLNALFCAFLKFVDERQQREQFERADAAMLHAQHIQAAEAQLRDFALAVTPRYLRPRLLRASEVVADVADDALIVNVDAFDCVAFSTTLTPHAAALAFATLQLLCHEDGERYGLTAIRTAGDATTLVGKLFDGLAHPIDAVHFALLAAGFAPPNAPTMQCRAAAALGRAVGMPLGVTCVRYDVFGPAVAEAAALLAVTPARGASLGKALAALVAQQYAVNDDGLVVGAADAKPDEPEGACASATTTVADDPPAATYSAEDTKNMLFRAQSSVLLRNGALCGVRLEPAPTACCCTCTSLSGAYADADTEAQFQLFRRAHDRGAFVACCGFIAALSVALLALAAHERRGDFDDGMIASVVCLGATAAAAGALVLVTLCWAPLRSELCPAQFAALLAVCALLMTGANFSRPSLVGDDIGYLLITTTAVVVLAGAPLRWVMWGQLALLVLEFVLHASYRLLLMPYNFIYNPLLNFALWSGAVYREAQMRALFEADVLSRNSLDEVEEHRRLRIAILDGRVPRQLQHRLDPKGPIIANSVQTFSYDDVVVIAIELAAAAGGSGGSGDASANPQALHDAVEASIAVVEAALQAAAQHRTLDIVRRAGGSVLVAGPLDASAGTVAQAVDDAVRFLEALLRGPLVLTAGVAVEQLISVIHEGEFPSHDVFGMAVAHATALVAAAPAPMVVATEKFARHAAGGKAGVMPAGSGTSASVASGGSADLLISFATAESWRIRAVGAMRVCRVRLPRPENCASSEKCGESGSGSRLSSNTAPSFNVNSTFTLPTGGSVGLQSLFSDLPAS